MCFSEQNSQYFVLVIVVTVYKRFWNMFLRQHEYNSSFLDNIIILLLIDFVFVVRWTYKHSSQISYECNFIFLVPFTWFAQTLTTQKARNKSYTQTQNKGIMIHTSMPKKSSTITCNILQKKKIIQTQIHKHDKENEQWVITLWNTLVKIDIHRDFHAFFTWFLFLLWFLICIVFHVQY